MKDRLKELRTKSNLTLRELGEKVSIPYGTLGRFEKKTRIPNEDNWKQLASFYNVSIPYLQGAQSKKYIIEVLMNTYSNLYTGDENPSLTFKLLANDNEVVLFNDVEEYLIIKGVIPYDVPKVNNLLDEFQATNLDFWLDNFKDIFNTTSMRWLLTKPSLEASTDDIVQALVESLSYNISNIISAQSFRLALNKYYSADNKEELKYQVNNLDKRNAFLQNMLKQRTSKTNSPQ